VSTWAAAAGAATDDAHVEAVELLVAEDVLPALRAIAQTCSLQASPKARFVRVEMSIWIFRESVASGFGCTTPPGPSFVGVRGRHRMVGPLDVVVRGGREDGVAERLHVALETG
jgi:hypothetical protein